MQYDDITHLFVINIIYILSPGDNIQSGCQDQGVTGQTSSHTDRATPPKILIGSDTTGLDTDRGDVIFTFILNFHFHNVANKSQHIIFLVYHFLIFIYHFIHSYL